MTPPVRWSFELEIKTEKQADGIVEALDEQERKILLDALNKKMWIKEEITENKENNYENLLNKPNMTAKDKANMEKSIKFLVDRKMDTSENLEKLETINYGSNYIEIAWLKFSREKFVPEVKFNDTPNASGVFESNEKGIYKTIYNGNPEYFLTIDQYIQQAKKQWKTAIEDDHMRKALEALPWEFSDNNRYNWGNILWNILDLSMSGCVHSDGELWNEDKCGYLSSASPVHELCTRAFKFNEDGGGLYDDYDRSHARPCLSLLK